MQCFMALADPTQQTNFESKFVVGDRNTKAPAAAATAGGCVLGAAEGTDRKT